MTYSSIMYLYLLHIIQANGRALIDAMQLPALVGITCHGHLQETRAQDMPDGPLVQSSEKYYAKPLAVPGFKRAQRGVLQEPQMRSSLLFAAFDLFA